MPAAAKHPALRVLCKGAISFGLVREQIARHPT